MSIEGGGGIGGGISGGGIGSAVATGVGIGSSIGGIEGGGFSGLGRIGSGPAVMANGFSAGLGLNAFGPKLTGPEAYIPAQVNEGVALPSAFAGFKRIGPVETGSPNLGKPALPVENEGIKQPGLQEDAMQTQNKFKPKGQIKFNQPEILAKTTAFGVQTGGSSYAESSLFFNYEQSNTSSDAAWQSYQVSDTKEQNAKAQASNQKENQAPILQNLAYSTWTVTAPIPEAIAQSTTSIQPQLQKQEEEVIEEEIAVQKLEETEPENKDKEDLSWLKIKFVEAKKISEKRRQRIITAVGKIVGKITSRVFRQALEPEFWQLKSPITQGREDYTLGLTVSEIESNFNEYNNPAAAAQAYIKAVDNNIPVEQGENGRTATVAELEKVLYGAKEFFRSKAPAVLVIAKPAQSQVIVQEVAGMKAELTLAEVSTELAGVFQKAA